MKQLHNFLIIWAMSSAPALSNPLEMTLTSSSFVMPTAEAMSGPAAPVSTLVKRDSGPEAVITSEKLKYMYYVQVWFGDWHKKPIKLAVDTGSSLTWIPGEEVSCEYQLTHKPREQVNEEIEREERKWRNRGQSNRQNQTENESKHENEEEKKKKSKKNEKPKKRINQFNVKPGWDGCVPENSITKIDKSFSRYRKKHFHIGYLDGSQVKGYIACGPIRISAKARVWDQKIGIVTAMNKRITQGPYATGLLGLGGDPNDNSVTVNLYKAWYGHRSFALTVFPDHYAERANHSGLLTFGGVPTGLTLRPSTNWTKTKLLGRRHPVYDQYTIEVQLVWGDGVSPYVGTQHFPALVDSGTTLNWFPRRIADGINAAFEPQLPASEGGGYVGGLGYIVPCNSTAPSINFKIGGDILPIMRETMMVKTHMPGKCMSAFTPHDKGAYILGLPFFRNFIVYHNLKKGTLELIRYEL